MGNSDWSSYFRLVQELIAGHVRRHVFNGWELELLLDVQMTRMRKSSRPEIFRRYLRGVQFEHAAGAALPMRFSRFFETEIRARRPEMALGASIELPRAS